VKKLTIISGIPSYDLIGLYIRNPLISAFKLSDTELNTLRIIATSAIKSGIGELIGIYDTNNNLCTCGLFITANQKSHLVFFAQNAEARQNRLLYLVIDFFIKKQSEKNTTLCLYQSNQNCKIYDYKNLGAGLYHVPHVIINKLPWYLRSVIK
jgi:hypothetical protein